MDADEAIAPVASIWRSGRATTGGAGASEMYVNQRHLRFADGPDEVHHMVAGRAEISRH